MAQLKNLLTGVFSTVVALSLVAALSSPMGYAQTGELTSLEAHVTERVSGQSTEHVAEQASSEAHLAEQTAEPVTEQSTSDAQAAEQATDAPAEQGEEPVEDDSLMNDQTETEGDANSDGAASLQSEALEQSEGEEAPQESSELLAEEAGSKSNVAVVSTYQELVSKTTSSEVDTIILGADIAITANIAIPASKPRLTIDGQGRYALEQSGTYTFTASSAQQAVYTFKDLTIIGRSYYGVVWCTATQKAPALVFENVSYSGPQLLYNRYGSAEFYGANSVIIQQNGSSSQAAQEVGELHGITVYGTLDLEFAATASSFFWMFPVGTEKPYFTIAQGGKARFSTQHNLTNRGFFWVEGTTYPVMLSVEEGARLVLDLTGYNALCTSETHRIDTLYIGKNASVSFDFAGGIVLSNSFIVDEGAEVHLTYRNNPSTGAAATTLPLFRFLRTASTTPLLTLNNPKLVEFAVEPTNRALFSTLYANPLQITTTNVSYWDTFSAAQQGAAAIQTWSSEELGAFVATINLRAGQDALQSITATDEDFAARFNPTNARVLKISTKDTEWIKVRIPVKMLFGTLEEQGEESIISPVYEIQNDSTVPLQIKLVNFGVNLSDGITLLPDASAEQTGHDLKLDLLVEDGLALEYLHPSNITAEQGSVLETLAPNQKIQLSLGGTYYGTFEQGVTYKPQYSMVWSFTPRL